MLELLTFGVSYDRLDAFCRTDREWAHMTEQGTSRRGMMIGAAGTLVASPLQGALARGAPAAADGFDFLHGRWTVHHRKLVRRLAGSNDWIDFPGTLEVRPILGGHGNIDENVLEDPGGTYLATSIRIFDAGAGAWSIYWADARFGSLDAPVTGRFDGRIGRFYGNDVFEGRPIRVRTTYENLGTTHAQWTQAFSPDGGKQWETNWIMDFRREASR